MAAKTEKPEAEAPEEETETALAAAFGVAFADATLPQRMVAILAELPAVGKGEWNEQQKFHYRSHDQVLNALNPLLAKYGVFMLPKVIERIPGERITGNNKTMYEINLHVEFTFIGAKGDQLVASAWGEGTDMGDKATNKAMTMAFKNVIAQAFAVSTAETIDTDSQTPQETVRPGTQPAAPQQPSGERTGGSTRQRRGPFDPGKQLLEGALPLDAEFWRQAGEALLEIGPAVDWRETLAPAVLDRFGVPHRDQLGEEDGAEYARRLSNLIRKIQQDHDTTAFPPVADTSPEAIEAAARFAFSTKVDVPIVLLEDPIEAAEAALAEEALRAAEADEPPGDESQPETPEQPVKEQREHRDPTA